MQINSNVQNAQNVQNVPSVPNFRSKNKMWVTKPVRILKCTKSTKCTKSGNFNVLKIHIFKMIHFSCVEIPFALSDESSAP